MYHLGNVYIKIEPPESLYHWKKKKKDYCIPTNDHVARVFDQVMKQCWHWNFMD